MKRNERKSLPALIPSPSKVSFNISPYPRLEYFCVFAIIWKQKNNSLIFLFSFAKVVLTNTQKNMCLLVPCSSMIAFMTGLNMKSLRILCIEEDLLEALLSKEFTQDLRSKDSGSVFLLSKEKTNGLLKKYCTLFNLFLKILMVVCQKMKAIFFKSIMDRMQKIFFNFKIISFFQLWCWQWSQWKQSWAFGWFQSRLGPPAFTATSRIFSLQVRFRFRNLAKVHVKKFFHCFRSWVSKGSSFDR